MFLSEINIKNLAIIEDAKINFAKGFNVISGETGAGKSIIIKAINILLGERIKSKIIRPGKDFCSVQAVFEKIEEVSDLLEDNGIIVENELNIKRVISVNGKSKAYINDTLVTQKTLSNLGSNLVSILSQNENQKLFNNSFQLLLLDKFLFLEKERKELNKVFINWKESLNNLEAFKKNQKEYNKRSDYLSFQVKEIEELDLKEDEEKDLDDLIKRTDHANEILKLVSNDLDLISYSENSISSKINSFISNYSKYRDLDDNFSSILTYVNDLVLKFEELEDVLNKVLKSYDFDSEDIEKKRERLAEIRRLKKKFNVFEISDLLENYKQMKDELSNLSNLDNEISNLEKEVKKLELQYFKLAENLSEKRILGSKKLSTKIEKTLKDLGLLESFFEVLFKKGEATSFGIDKIDFLIKTNPGMPIEPIVKIASGGEISRIMLAIQAATNEIYGYGVQVFDEVDAGIGGDIGFRIGDLLKLTSLKHQVIVITHLPQIAVYADHHIKVDKKVRGDETIVNIEKLTKNNSLNEISRMFGMLGDETTIENIRNMINKVEA